jgi:dTDP-4-dehydrorhamnose 3,5-epimerase
MPLEARTTRLRDALLFTPDVFTDARGFFKEAFSAEKYRAFGVHTTFAQDGVSLSVRNVIRGMHGDRRISKLVQVLRGEVFDVIVDAREESPTYGQWESFRLSESNHLQLYVPAGFLHGYLVLSEDAVLLYKQSAPYDPAYEFNIRWNDPTLAIAWPLAHEPILSERDQASAFFAPVDLSRLPSLKKPE